MHERIGELERAHGHQRHERCGDEKDRGGGLAAGKRPELKENEDSDREHQAQGPLGKEQRNEKAYAAAYGHQDDEAEGAFDIERSARGQKLHGDERGKEGKVPAKQMAERKSGGRRERDPEGQRMFAGADSLGQSLVWTLN